MSCSLASTVHCQWRLPWLRTPNAVRHSQGVSARATLTMTSSGHLWFSWTKRGKIAHRTVSDLISYRAGSLAELHALRGYDAVHLATALRFAEDFADLQFLSFDKRLNDAARQAGLSIYGEAPGGDAEAER